MFSYYPLEFILKIYCNHTYHLPLLLRIFTGDYDTEKWLIATKYFRIFKLNMHLLDGFLTAIASYRHLTDTKRHNMPSR